jgi:tetratricopeptide (TPR) repeat protein
MLDLIIPSVNQRIEVLQRRIQVTIGGGSFDPVRVEFPPVEEISKMRGLASGHVSFHKVQRDSTPGLQQAFRETAKALERKREKYIDSPGFHARLADVFFLAGDSARAYELNDVARKLSGETVFRLRYGSDLIAEGRFSEADRLFSELAELDSSERLARRAAVALLMNDKEEAYRLASSAVGLSPDNDKARYLLGLTCLVRSECAQAIRHFRAASEGYPRSVPLLVNLAISHVCLGQNEKALDALRKAVNINPIHKTAVCMLADLAYSSERASVSVRSLETYLEYDQQSVDVWARMARAYFAVGELEKSLSSLKHQGAIEEVSTVWNNMGVVAHELGRDAFVGQYFTRAVRLSEDSQDPELWGTPVRNLLAWLIEHGQIQEAIKLGKRAVEKDVDGTIIERDDYSEIYLFYLLALSNSRFWKEFTRVAHAFAENPRASEKIRLGAYSALIHYHTLVLGDLAPAFEIADKALQLLRRMKVRQDEVYLMLMNDVGDWEA